MPCSEFTKGQAPLTFERRISCVHFMN